MYCAIEILLQNTEICLSSLGWLFAGSCDSMPQPNSANSLFAVHLTTQLDIQEQLTNFWKFEEVPDFSQPADDYCERHFIETSTRYECRRYVVNLPKKDSLKQGIHVPNFSPTCRPTSEVGSDVGP
jgi:hypothetical protein